MSLCPYIAIVLYEQWFLGFILRVCPLPALSNAGEGAVHAGQQEQQLEHQHHRRQHQAEHVAGRSVPFVGFGVKEPDPPIQVGVKGTEEQREVA